MPPPCRRRLRQLERQLRPAPLASASSAVEVEAPLLLYSPPDPARLGYTEPTTEAVCAALRADGCALLERPSATACRYRVAGRGVGLGTTFRTLEAMKAEGLTAEYSVGMTTLEQIFNGFASSQENPEVE